MNNAELVELLLNRLEEMTLRNAALQACRDELSDKLYDTEQALDARMDVQELKNLGSDIRNARESLDRVMQGPGSCKISLIKLYRSLNKTGLSDSKIAIEESALWRALRAASDIEHNRAGAIYDLPGI
jgi:ribosomal protein L7/L12|tara:strand:- start:30 stop:413 length:384 start_codon:yes stop_codon:yes gene_type:complete